LGYLARAGVASTRGDHRRARSALEQAIATLDEAGMEMYAAIARQSLASLGGGAAVADSGWWGRESIADPGRFTALIAPGFAPRSLPGGGVRALPP
jgi:hypothetical protein